MANNISSNNLTSLYGGGGFTVLPTTPVPVVEGTVSSKNLTTLYSGVVPVNANIGGGGGGTANIVVLDQGNIITTHVQSFDFVGTGVVATSTGNAVTVTITTGEANYANFAGTAFGLDASIDNVVISGGNANTVLYNLGNNQIAFGEGFIATPQGNTFWLDSGYSTPQASYVGNVTTGPLTFEFDTSSNASFFLSQPITKLDFNIGTLAPGNPFTDYGKWHISNISSITSNTSTTVDVAFSSSYKTLPGYFPPAPPPAPNFYQYNNIQITPAYTLGTLIPTNLQSDITTTNITGGNANTVLYTTGSGNLAYGEGFSTTTAINYSLSNSYAPSVGWQSSPSLPWPTFVPQTGPSGTMELYFSNTDMANSFANGSFTSITLNSYYDAFGPVIGPTQGRWIINGISGKTITSPSNFVQFSYANSVTDGPAQSDPDNLNRVITTPAYITSKLVPNYLIANIANVNISGGTNGYVLSTDGNSNLSWSPGTSGIYNGTSNVTIPVVDGNVLIAVNGISNVATFASDSIDLNYPINTPNNIFIGNSAGNRTAAQDYYIAIGTNAGNQAQGANAIAIGHDAGILGNTDSIAIGTSAGQNQRVGAVAIGYQSGLQSQLDTAVAIGYQAGQSQDYRAVGVGYQAGRNLQGGDAIAIGTQSGYQEQRNNAIAIGVLAGSNFQGEYSIAIGASAGRFTQATNSIILNATGSTLDVSTPNTFTVKPIRQSTTTNALYYDATSGEITYDLAGSGGAFIANGNTTVIIPIADGNVDVTVNNNTVATFTDTGANIIGYLSITGNLDASNANLGNLAIANFFSGDGGLLSNIAGANVSGEVANANYATYAGNVTGTVANANYAAYAGNVTISDQPNITTVGNLIYLNVRDDSNTTSVIQQLVPNTVAILTNNTTNVAYNVTTEYHPNASIAYPARMVVRSRGDATTPTTAVSGDRVSADRFAVFNGNANVLVGGETWTLFAGGTLSNLANQAYTGGQWNIVTGNPSGSNLANATANDGLNQLIFTNSGSLQITPGTAPNTSLGQATSGLLLQNWGLSTTDLVGVGGINSQKARGNRDGALSVQPGDDLGRWNIWGYNGTNYQTGNAAALVATVASDYVANASIIPIDMRIRAVSNTASPKNTWFYGNGLVSFPDGINATGTANVNALNVTGISNLGNVGNVKITGGTANYVLKTDGAGNLDWVAQSGGNSISNGTSNVSIPSVNGNIYSYANGNLVMTISDSLVETSDLRITNSNRVHLGAGAGITSQGNTTVAIGNSAGSNAQADSAVAIGLTAGSNTQGVFSVAIGSQAGFDNQLGNSVAIGRTAGTYSQGDSAVAVGFGAGYTGQGDQTVAIGQFAGYTTQGIYGVAIGAFAGTNNQAVNSIAIGNNSGSNIQRIGSIAIGENAGAENQGIQPGGGPGGHSIAIGASAGSNLQSNNAISIGYNAGTESQGFDSISIGRFAGTNVQSSFSIAVGFLAGQETQGSSSIAIGAGAGVNYQGNNAIALGAGAGDTSQGDNTIIINATGTTLDQTTANTFTVKPVRQNNQPNLMFYNNTTGEISYDLVANIPTNYGEFYSNVSQTNPNISNVNVMTFNNTGISNNVSIVSNSRVTMAVKSKYNLQFSAQLAKVSGGASPENAYIWLRKNGTDVAWTAGDTKIAGNGDRIMAAWNYIVDANAGDYYELAWSATSTGVNLVAAAPAGLVPGIASVILTVVTVGA